MTDLTRGSGTDPVQVPERLLSSLDRLLQRRAAVIAAPAGYGKTTLIRSWLDRQESPTLYVPTSQVGPAEIDTVKAWLGGQQPTPTEPAIIAVDMKICPADCGHLAGLARMVGEDAGLRLILSARGRPEIPLGRLAVRGHLLDIDQRELELTRSEVRSFLAPDHPELTEGGLAAIYELVGGWPLFVHLIGQEPISWGQGPRMLSLTNSLMSEVLAGTSEEDIELLTRLATLRTLDQPSVAYLSGRGDAGAQLLRLANKGLPIKWDSQNAITFNPALREHLLRNLGQNDPELLSDLQRRAALWLRQRGRIVDAMLHAADHGETELALAMFTDYSLMHIFTEPHELRPVIDQMEARLGRHWRISMAQAAVWASSEPASVHPETIEVLRAELPDNLNLAEQALMAGFTLALAREVGYAGIDIEDALEVAKTVSPESAGQAVTAVLLIEYGLVLLHRGQALEAQPMLFRGVTSARIGGVFWAAVMALGALAWTYADIGESVQTSRLAEEAKLLAEGQGLGDSATLEYADLALSVNCIDRGDYAGVRRYVALSRRREFSMCQNEAMWAYVEATGLLGEGNPGQALAVVSRFRAQHPNRVRFDQHLMACAAFNAYLSMKKFDEAETELRAIEATLPPADSGAHVYESRLLMAQGRWEDAFSTLEDAAAREHYVSKDGKRILHMLMTYGVVADARGRTDLALDAFQRAGTVADQLGLNVPGARHTTIATSFRSDPHLTDAEMKVLKSLSSTATLPETAEQLFISINTLKTHLRRIYKKLGVANREEAIDWARLMGMVG